MKRLLFLLSICTIAGCQPAAEQLTPLQQQVTEYIKKNADDPASYQPVRWGKELPWQQKDVDKASARMISSTVGEATVDMERAYQRLLVLTEAGATTAEKAPFQKDYDQYFARAQKLRKTEDSLNNSTATQTLGVTMMHAYRAKNKMGALVLDSARFLVLKNGGVQVLE